MATKHTYSSKHGYKVSLKCITDPIVIEDSAADQSDLVLVVCSDETIEVFFNEEYKESVKNIVCHYGFTKKFVSEPKSNTKVSILVFGKDPFKLFDFTKKIIQEMMSKHLHLKENEKITGICGTQCFYSTFPAVPEKKLYTFTIKASGKETPAVKVNNAWINLPPNFLLNENVVKPENT